MNIAKSILLQWLRYWGASLLVLVAGQHWITPDQQNEITVWFNGYSDFLVDTFLAAAIPAALGTFALLKNWLKIKVALVLPEGTSQASLRQMVKDAGPKAVITQDTDRVINA